MKKIFLYLIIISFYFSCNKENYVTPIEKSEIIKPIQMPKDFSFEFNYFTDSYNSKTKKFKRNYQNGNKTIKVELNKNELEEIYKLFKINHFENLPQNIENENVMTQPTFSTTLKLHENNKTISKTFTIGVGEIAVSQGKLFENISKRINSILENKQSIKDLKQTDIYAE